MSIIIKRIANNKIEKTVFEALQGLQYIPKQDRVFIKPNLASAFKPESPFITNYRVVKGAIIYLKEKGIKDITVREAPLDKDADLVFSMSGYKNMCKKLGVKIFDLETAHRKKVNWKFGELLLPEIVLNSEYINIPKIKTHLQTTVTLGLKNQKGLLDLATRRRFHQNLHENIAALAACIKPRISVVDATAGIEGNGPGKMGKIVPKINLIIAGTDLLAVDAVTSIIMGFDPEKIKHLVLAKDMGVGSFDDNISGESIKSVKMAFTPPSTNYRIFNVHYHWREDTCSGCVGVLGEIKKEALRNPRYLLNLLYRGFLTRIDLITGSVDNLPPNHGKVVCIGDCSYKAANKYKAVYIPGCPLSGKMALEQIRIFDHKRNI